MEEKLLEQSYRKKVIAEIKSDENVQRKVSSYKKQNMQNDNFHQYVKEYLESKLDSSTVAEMNIFANVNLQKRVSSSEAAIYKKEPERRFFVGEDEIDGLDVVYDDIDMNTTLRKSNVAYKYEDQCALQVYPEFGQLKSRVLLPHHYDVIPKDNNPEQAMCYIISNFDNTSRDKIQRDNNRSGYSQGDKYRDGVNQDISDYDDSKLDDERFTFWSNSFNFVTNGKGEVLDKETYQVVTDLENLQNNMTSPLIDYQITPFVDISKDKDFEYWVRSGDALFDATLMYNVILTSEFQTVEMQGHAQPYYKGDAEHMPENIRIGVDKLIYIPMNSNNPVDSEFGFANPGSDLSGIKEFRESYLSAFLTSRGLDVSVVSGSGNIQKATSGIEKMLQMIEKFDASQEDFSLFRSVENKAYKIILSWIASLKSIRIDDELVLSEKYQSIIADPNDANIVVEYCRPEMIETKIEKLELLEKEIEIGVNSKVHYMMAEKGMTEDQAIEYLDKVDEFEKLKIEEPLIGKISQPEIF